jgi:protein gp37
MSKMFTYNGKRMKTLNAFTGCNYSCTYCWAKSLVETRLKNTPKYKGCGFKPMYHGIDLQIKYKPDDWVFVTSMGDIVFCPNENLEQILYVVRNNPQSNFLFCTKNPKTYERFPTLQNIYYGCTIETNRDTSNFSKAPRTEFRYNIIRDLHDCNKFISIEPIMDFDYPIFVSWLTEINPKIVEIGADNYKMGLPEPSKQKVEALITILDTFGINVIHKDGLERLLK